MNKWQPIETAPKDGTAILVMRDIWPGTESGRAESCSGHNTYVAAFWEDEGPRGEWVCYMASVHEPVCPVEPTHWMPLPAPPSVTGETKPEPRIAGHDLRDYFAGQALQGMSANPYYDDYDFDRVSSMAYAKAEAMLAERAK